MMHKTDLIANMAAEPGLAKKDSEKALTAPLTTVTEALKREGMARDFVRLVQTLRKDKDFNISDRIELSYATDDAELAQALAENQAYIAEQVLAVKIDSSCLSGTEGDIEGKKLTFDAKVSNAKVA